MVSNRLPSTWWVDEDASESAKSATILVQTGHGWTAMARESHRTWLPSREAGEYQVVSLADAQVSLGTLNAGVARVFQALVQLAETRLNRSFQRRLEAEVRRQDALLQEHARILEEYRLLLLGSPERAKTLAPAEITLPEKGLADRVRALVAEATGWTPTVEWVTDEDGRLDPVDGEFVLQVRFETGTREELRELRRTVLRAVHDSLASDTLENVSIQVSGM